MDAIRSVRNIRSQMNVVPSRKAKLIIVTDNTAMFENTGIYFEKLASASETVVTSDKSDVDDNAVNVVVEGATIYIPLDELVDRSKEIERLEKELKTLEAEIKRVEGKLGNAGFVAKAPAHVVEEEKAKGEKYAKMLSEVKLSLEKELKTLEGEIKRVEGKLGNAGFVAKAPAHVVEEEKAKGEKYAKMLSEVKASLEKLK